MNATAKRKEMKQHQAYIESAGFEVRMQKDGSLEVKDPSSSAVIKLSTPSQAGRFIKGRS